MLQREIYQNLWEDRSSQKKWWVCDCCGNHLKVKGLSLKCALTVFILWAATLSTVKYGNPSLLTVIRLLCLGATVFFLQQKIPSEILGKLCPFTLFSPSCSPPHTHCFPGSQLCFSLSFLLKPPVPSPHSTTPASCFKEQSGENCCHRDSLFLSLCAQLPCQGCGDYTHFSRAGSAIEPWGPSLWRTARHQFKKCLTLFWASLISPSLWIILISKQLQYFSS